MAKIFVGVPLADEMREVAARVCGEVSHLGGFHAVADQDLHLTIVPPWEERQPDAVVRDLAAISSPPVRLTFDRAGYGPSAGPARLAWVLASRTPELDRLWLQTWRALWSQDPSAAPLPHVTVAYFDGGEPLPPLGGLLPGEVSLSRVAVYESLGGHRFRILGERVLG